MRQIKIVRDDNLYHDALKSGKDAIYYTNVEQLEALPKSAYILTGTKTYGKEQASSFGFAMSISNKLLGRLGFRDKKFSIDGKFLILG